MAKRFAYLPYLCFGEACLSIFCQCVSIVLMAHLLVCSWRRTFGPFTLKYQLSRSLLVYLYAHVLCSCAAMGYHVYLVAAWSPTQANAYRPKWLFWSGLWALNYVAIAPFTVTLLTLDRCLMLTLPLHYTRRRQMGVAGAGGVLIALLYAGSTLVFLLELPLDEQRSGFKVFENELDNNLFPKNRECNLFIKNDI